MGKFKRDGTPIAPKKESDYNRFYKQVYKEVSDRVLANGGTNQDVTREIAKLWNARKKNDNEESTTMEEQK